MNDLDERLRDLAEEYGEVQVVHLRRIYDVGQEHHVVDVAFTDEGIDQHDQYRFTGRGKTEESALRAALDDAHGGEGR